MMGLFEQWPYVNFHELNLDWLIKKLKQYDDADAHLAEYAERAETAADGAEESEQAAASSAESAGISADRSAQYAANNNMKSVFMDINSLASGKFLCVGDSYAGGYDPDVGYSILANGWAKQLQTMLGITDDNRFTIYHDGGTGFANASNFYTWGDQIEQYASQVQNPDTVSHIIFCGGYNDKDKTEAEILSGISIAVNRCRVRYPNARVYIACVANSSTFADYAKLKNVHYAYKIGCVAQGATYLNAADCSLWSSAFFSSDGYHPNASGNQQVAMALKYGLCGNDDWKISSSVTITPESDVTFVNTNNGVTYENGNLQFKMNGQTVSFSNRDNVTLNGITVPICKTNCTLIRQQITQTVKAQNVILVYDISGNRRYKDACCGFTIVNNDTIAVQLNVTNDTGTNYLTCDLKQIQFPQIGFVITPFTDMMF